MINWIPDIAKAGSGISEVFFNNSLFKWVQNLIGPKKRIITFKN